MPASAVRSELNASDTPQALVVCRSQRWWGQIRQARWVEGVAWVRFFPRIDELLGVARAHTRCFVCIELPASQPESCLEGVWRLASGRRLHRVVCLAEPTQIACEFPFREVGAIEFASSVADFPRVQAAFARHVQSLPPLRLPWEQAIIQQLPWRSVLPENAG